MRKQKQITSITQAKNLVAEGVKSKKQDARSSYDAAKMLTDTRVSVTLLIACLLERLGAYADSGFAYVGTAYSNNANGGRVPTFYMSINNTEGFTDPHVVSALEFLTREFSDCSTQDYASSLGRSYQFERPDMRVELVVYVKGDSPTCKRVEVGEETVVQKKYKIVCEG
jgi:hypothetical protein